MRSHVLEVQYLKGITLEFHENISLPSRLSKLCHDNLGFGAQQT